MVRTFDVLQSDSIADEVFIKLRRAIVEGVLPGSSRLVESQIASEMGISRAPVREALRRLQQEGLVIDYPRRGKYVANVTLSDIENLYAVRVALEEVAIRTIIEKGTVGVVETLERIAAAMNAAAQHKDLARVVEFEFEFHETICKSSGNRYLVGAFRSISAQIRMGLLVDNSKHRNLATIAAEHEPLIDVIRKGETTNIPDVVYKHTWNIA